MESRAAPDRRYLCGLLAWSAVLVAGHVALHLSWRFRRAPEPLRELFAFASESSLVTWTSVVAMFALGAACWVLGGRRRDRRWSFAGAFFVYLSLDDGAMLHERLSRLTGIDVGITYTWTVVVLPVLALAGLFVLAHLWRETKGERRARRHVVLACAMWGGALLLELPERALFESGLSWRGFPAFLYTQLAEEWLELVAPGVLLAAVLQLLARGSGSNAAAHAQEGD